MTPVRDCVGAALFRPPGVQVISLWIPGKIGSRVKGMNGQGIVGVIMIVAGAGLLAYGGFTTTSRENVIDLGPLKVQADVKERHSVPPVLSWALLGGGVIVLVLGMKRK